MNAVVSELVIGAEPAAWTRVGVPSEAGVAEVGGIRLVFDPVREGLASLGIAGFTGDDRDLSSAFDGLPVHPAAPAHGSTAPNEMGAVGIELLSIATSSAIRTAQALGVVTGFGAGEVRERSGMVMGYAPLGPTQAEVVESAEAPADAATLGGMIIVVADLDALTGRLGLELISEPRLAVQFDRRIATFRPAAELGAPIAAMTPAPAHAPTADEVQEWRALRAAARRG